MSLQARHIWQSRVLNGCLIAVVLLALAPQYWPAMATISGIGAIACGVVAAVVYFISPSVEEQDEAGADARAGSEHATLDAVIEGASELAIVKAASKPKLPKPAYDLYGGPIKDYEKAVIRWWALEQIDEQQLGEVRRIWARKLVALERANLASVGQDVYFVPTDKIRRKVPRSQGGGMEAAIAPLRSRAIH